MPWVMPYIPGHVPSSASQHVYIPCLAIDNPNSSPIILTNTIDANKGIFNFKRISIEIMLMIFDLLKLSDVLSFLRCSSDLRAMFGSIPEFCNHLIRTRFATESAFFDSQIVNGYLVPSRAKFDSLVNYIHWNALSSIADKSYFFRPKFLESNFTYIKLPLAVDWVALIPQLDQASQMETKCYFRFFEGTPLYLLFLSGLSGNLGNMKRAILRICKGRGFNLDPDSLYQAFLNWATYDWAGLHNSRVALLPTQNSQNPRTDVSLAELPMSVRMLLRYSGMKLPWESEVTRNHSGGDYWEDPMVSELEIDTLFDIRVKKWKDEVAKEKSLRKNSPCKKLRIR